MDSHGELPSGLPRLSPSDSPTSQGLSSLRHGRHNDSLTTYFAVPAKEFTLANALPVARRRLPPLRGPFRGVQFETMKPRVHRLPSVHFAKDENRSRSVNRKAQFSYTLRKEEHGVLYYFPLQRNGENA